MSSQRSLDGSHVGTAAVSSQHGESDADEGELGSSFPATSEREVPEQQSQIVNWEEIRARLDGQQQVWKRYFEAMRDEVWLRAQRQAGSMRVEAASSTASGQATPHGGMRPDAASSSASGQVTPHTPILLHSTSEATTLARHPPQYTHSGEPRGQERAFGSGSGPVGWTALTRAIASGDTRESTVQLWSRLGDELRKLKLRNLHLKIENEGLDLKLKAMRQEAAEYRQLLQGEPSSDCQASDSASSGLPPRLPGGDDCSRCQRPPQLRDSRRHDDFSSTASLLPSDGEESNTMEST
mmetsp:Transcript_19018/g.39613  ORF Transcript_19018/g.39613 Transcript_19018/m.39613 type:complete len:296 (-) Transcript_19018:41-928(-)